MAERSIAVRLRAEVDQFRRDMQQAGQAVHGVTSAAEQAGKARTGMQQLGQAGRDVGRTLVAVSGAAAAGMVALGTSAFATGAAYNTLEQTSRAALKTLLGSVEAANEQMDKLREFGSTSPFPRQVWIEAQQQLLAFGMAAERVIPTLAGIQDAVAAAGGGAVDIQEIVRVLAQVQSTGKVTAETLNQLGTRGVDAATLIGDAMGMSAAEIREQISSGALDAATFLQTLTDQMTARFGGAAANIRQTWIGATDRIKGALRDIGSAMAEPFIDPRGGGAAVRWGNDVADMLRALESRIRPLVAELRGRAEPTFEVISNRLQSIAERIRELDLTGMIDQVSAGAPAWAALGGSIAAAGSAALLAGVPGLGALTGAINPLSAAILAAAAASPELRAVLVDLLETLAPLLPVLMDTANIVAGAMTTGLATVADVIAIIVPLVEALVEGFRLLPDGVQQATLAVTGFALALRFGGHIGAAITALAALGVVMEQFGVESVGASVATQNLTEDLARLQETGRVTGELWRLFGEDTAFFAHELDLATTLASNRFAQFSNLTMKVGTDLGIVQNNLQDAADRFSSLDQGLATLVANGADADEVLQALADTYNLSDEQLADLVELLPEYNKEAQRQAERGKDVEESQDGVTTAVERATNAMKEQRDEMRAAADPVFAVNKALQDVQAAQQGYTTAVEEHGGASDEAKAKALELFEATLELQGAVADAGQELDGNLTPAMRATLRAAGLTEDQIDAIADAFDNAADAGNQYATEYAAEVELEGAKDVEDAAKRIKARLDAIDRTVQISFSVAGAASVGAINIPGKAHGGPVDWGPRGVDRVPIMATRGEHVWTAQEVRAAGGHQAVEELRAAVLAGATRFAVGGPVGMPRAHVSGARLTPGGWHVENLNVQAWSDRFSLRQVEQELAMQGAL